jgi:hypothetical protein
MNTAKFHHDISQNEKRYSRKRSPNMSADYCRSLIRETPTGKNKRQEKMKLVFNEIFSSYDTIYTYTPFII